MKFTFTHPMHSNPYNPELVTGSGIATVAEAAEAAGFDGFGFTDHPAPTQRWLEAGGHDAVDPFVAMAFAAARTTTLRLIPNIVVLPYRNPFVVAKSGATLDFLSDGRFTLAVGVGYLKREFAAKGITAHPRPVSKPHPPIWIGGNTAAARQRVARFGDGWCPFPAPAVLAQTARTAALDSLDALAEGIADLQRRCAPAAMDGTGIDITFSNRGGGAPGDDDFNADAYLSALEQLAAVGVTWAQVQVPGDSLQRAVDAIGLFGSSVIASA